MSVGIHARAGKDGYLWVVISVIFLFLFFLTQFCNFQVFYMKYVLFYNLENHRL